MLLHLRGVFRDPKKVSRLTEEGFSANRSCASNGRSFHGPQWVCGTRVYGQPRTCSVFARSRSRTFTAQHSRSRSAGVLRPVACAVLTHIVFATATNNQKDFGCCMDRTWIPCVINQRPLPTHLSFWMLHSFRI